MINTVDKSTILFEMNNFVSPIKPGIANTAQVLYWYMFTEGNELNYTSSIANATTVTFSELPTNTVIILVQIWVSGSGGVGVYTRRQASGDQHHTYIDNGITTLYSLVSLPTKNNTIYIEVEYTTCTRFNIFGYGIKL